MRDEELSTQAAAGPVKGHDSGAGKVLKDITRLSERTGSLRGGAKC
jgi:hypothetical protein